MRLAPLTALLPAALLLALGTGPGAVGVGEALQTIGAHLGLTAPTPGLRDAIVWELRLPRALLAALVGAALASAGVLTQGLFRNPLADPGILGVSAGAMLAAVIGFMFGAEQHGLWVTPLLAAGGAALVLLVLLALHRARQSLATLLLSGFALGTLCAAVATLCLAFGAQRWDLGIRVMQWSLGSFEGRTWIHLAWAIPPCVIGLALATWLTAEPVLPRHVPDAALPRLRRHARALDRARQVVVEVVPELDAPGSRLEGAGTMTDPIRIPSLPFVDLRSTADSTSDMIDNYLGACDETKDESGPEVFYKLEVTAPIDVRIMVFDRANVDVDVHVLSKLAAENCLKRNDREITGPLPIGTYYIAVDSFAGDVPDGAAGEYAIVVMED